MKGTNKDKVEDITILTQHIHTLIEDTETDLLQSTGCP